ncbi:PTS sugar transporter subunit IIB [Garciella nitratireducens]|uniref:PTS system, cellobiose-specific IIB component n=1 Tax=Garciella nitratireducens DSM 15102 TaxID=1121911 RepID=A0A1T4M0F4_9FIRM|nr:PTS sugar transporter subunit IIB [Garciella nitratireducens]SJZ60463.1 PTS system, cellobiose-specific IIB component [Garciella nitratireducens DSM 15102]
MKSIMLVCAAGMSTSLLVSKMKKAAEKKGIEADIFSVAAQEAEETVKRKHVDVVLLGPQVRYRKEQFQKSLGGISVEAIDMKYYGTMNGEKVLEQALSLIKE